MLPPSLALSIPHFATQQFRVSFDYQEKSYVTSACSINRLFCVKRIVKFLLRVTERNNKHIVMGSGQPPHPPPQKSVKHKLLKWSHL